MFGRIYLLAAAALCISSYALAATPSIGSVTGHVDGELKIDNYSVKGGGTVFDGSVVETGRTVESIAAVRLGNNSVITLEADSRGTVYRDHFVLQRGTIELGSSASFRVEVNGLVVTPSESHSSGAVSIKSENTVDVEAKTGNLEVRESTGRLVAEVHPGNPLAFRPANGEPFSVFAATGSVDKNNAAATVLASGISNLGGFGLGRSAQSRSLVEGLSVTPATTIIKKCLSVSQNGQTESLCCTGGPTPEFCCPGANQFASGLCCVSGAPGSMCHHSR